MTILGACAKKAQLPWCGVDNRRYHKYALFLRVELKGDHRRRYFAHKKAATDAQIVKAQKSLLRRMAGRTIAIRTKLIRGANE